MEKVIGQVVLRYPKHLRSDLVQECWLVGLEYLNNFDPNKGKLSTFLYKRLHGTCIDWISKHIIEDAVEVEPYHLIEDAFEFEFPVKETERDVIVRKIKEGYTVKEIKDQIESIGSIETIYYRLRSVS